MKRKNIFMIALVALATASLTSCLKDDEELFAEKSAHRITAAMKEASDMLPTAEYGWILEMYPEKTQMYGGWTYCVRFDAERAYVSSELAETPKVVTTSLWKMTNDNGPTLTLDTYNELFHYYATPSSDNYQALKGDFEFMVMEVTPDLIRLRGKKTHNAAYLRRLTMPAEEYITKQRYVDDRLVFSKMEGNVGGHSVVLEPDLDNRQLSFTVDGEEKAETAYCVTPEGIRLYEDVEIADGVSVSDIPVTIDPAVNKPSAATLAGSTLQITIPAHWHALADYVGSYELRARNSSGDVLKQDVEITVDEDGKTMWLSGVSDSYDIKVSYNKSTGGLNLLSQIFYDKGHKEYAQAEVSGKKYYLGMTMFSIDVGQTSGYISYSKTVGVTTKVTNDDNGALELSLVDNGVWKSYKARAFRLYPFTSTSMSSTTRNTSISLPNVFRFHYGGIYSMTLYQPHALIKK